MRLIPVVLMALIQIPIAMAADPGVEILIGPTAPDPGRKVSPGKLHHPFGVDFDSAGNMLIAEYTGGRLFKWTPEQKLIHIAGAGKPGYSGDGGPPLEAAFQDLHNVVVASNGDLFLSDHKNHAVRKVDSKTGVVSTYAGGKSGFAGDGDSVSKARFNMVMCVTIDPSRKFLVIADIRNYRIRRIDLARGVVDTVAGNGKKGKPKDGSVALDAPLVDPRAAAYDAHGNLYIVERGGQALRVVDAKGKIRTVVGTGKKGNQDGPGLSATLNGPKHLAIGPEGGVFLADDFNHRIRRYDPKTGKISTVLGHGAIKLNRPHGVHVRQGWLYVADSWNQRVIRMKLETQ